MNCGWVFGSYRDQYSTEKKRGRKRRPLPPLAIAEWDEEDAEAWENEKSGRPEEFKQVWHTVVATMATLQNNCAVAYAMLNTGVFVDVREDDFAKPSPVELRFLKAKKEYESLSFDQQCRWCERIVGRYPRLQDIVEAMS